MPSTTVNQISINAELITVFQSHQDWVNRATRAIGGKRSNFGEIVCIDKNGNNCAIGHDMALARDNDAFPVTAYRLVAASEVYK